MLTSVLSVLRVLIWLSIIPAMLLRISFASGAGLLPIDLLLPLYSFLWLFDSIVIRRQIPLSIRFLRLPIIWCCIGFIGYIYSKYYMSSSEMILSLWHMIRFISLIIWGISYTELVPKRTEKMIMIIYCILVILGFIAFYLVPDMGKYSKEGQWDPHIGRFLSTLLDPNYMAGMLLFMITTLLSRILQPLHFSRYIYIILCFISLIALYMTFSRSGYVAFIISFITFLMLYNWRIIAISSIFIVLIMLSNMNIEVSENRSLERMSAMIDTAKGLFLGDISSTDPTSLMRLQSWKDSLELYKEAPIIGIGFNTYRPIATSKGIVPDGYFNSGGSDSSLLNVLITTGFIGFIVFISFIIDMLYTHYRLYKTTYDTRYIAFIAGFIGIIAHSFFVNSLFYPFIMLFIMTLWGQNMSVYKDNNIDT